MFTEIKITDDGSNTLFVPELNESYHSVHGSIQESNHIFIQNGLKHCLKNSVKVLEIGFGTGLNTFLTLLETIHSDHFMMDANNNTNDIIYQKNAIQKVNYTTVELYPVEVEKALQLNFPEMIGKRTRSWFEEIHTSEWNKPVQITENFTLTKILTDYTKKDFSEKFDVIYFDAFSPEKQPEMWSEEVFKKLYLCCDENASLVTYCAKGMVRRILQSVGFRVERLPGPKGKREILRAVK